MYYFVAFRPGMILLRTTLCSSSTNGTSTRRLMHTSASAWPSRRSTLAPVAPRRCPCWPRRSRTIARTIHRTLLLGDRCEVRSNAQQACRCGDRGGPEACDRPARLGPTYLSWGSRNRARRSFGRVTDSALLKRLCTVKSVAVFDVKQRDRYRLSVSLNHCTIMCCMRHLLGQTSCHIRSQIDGLGEIQLSVFTETA